MTCHQLLLIRLDILLVPHSNSFHFHLMDIYIAPLQGIYSEALPTPAWRKRTVLRLERNTDGIDLGSRRSSRGNPFQVKGFRTEKARFCLTEIRANEMERGGEFMEIDRSK